MAARSEVLRLYRSVLRRARTWEALDPMETSLERSYIVQEAGEQFRAAKGLADAEAKTALADARDRIEIAAHYNIPFPRLAYAAPQTSFHGGKKSSFKRSDQWQRP